MAFRHLTLARRADISSRHARHVHKCICGREIRGNAYANHQAACPAYQAWKAEFDAEMASRYDYAPGVGRAAPAPGEGR